MVHILVFQHPHHKLHQCSSSFRSLHREQNDQELLSKYFHVLVVNRQNLKDVDRTKTDFSKILCMELHQDEKYPNQDTYNHLDPVFDLFDIGVRCIDNTKESTIS